jgi:hypothetical protein
MRHPFFKDARETESQKMQTTESPRGVKTDAGAVHKKTGGLHNSGKQKALDGSSKMHAVLNKALPNINSGADENTAKSHFQVTIDSLSPCCDPSVLTLLSCCCCWWWWWWWWWWDQASNVHGNSDHHGSGKHHNSKHLPFTNSQGIVDESSLPPIAGGGQHNSKNFTNTNDSTRSNRSLQGQQLKTKKPKKLKSNYSHDTTKKKSGEQVLRTYGLSGKNTLNSNSEVHKHSDAKSGNGPKAGGASGYSHPNRHYVAKR